METTSRTISYSTVYISTDIFFCWYACINPVNINNEAVGMGIAVSAVLQINPDFNATDFPGF